MSTCSDTHVSTSGLLGEQAVSALAETFRVLGDVTRVRILDALSRAELCVGDIADLLGLSESAVSHQLRVLRGMRLVKPRRSGQLIFYTLDDHHIVELFEQGLKHVQERGGTESRREGAAGAVERPTESSAAVSGPADADRAASGAR